MKFVTLASGRRVHAYPHGASKTLCGYGNWNLNKFVQQPPLEKMCGKCLGVLRDHYYLYADLMDLTGQLDYELAEAKSELLRHHNAFLKIRNIVG